MQLNSSNGQVLFKDGTTELIITYREIDDQIEVFTPSGKYIYIPYISCTPYGYKFMTYRFGCFNFNLNEYIMVDTIKEFEIIQEPTNDQT